MASLINKLSSGGPESAGFLNEIIAQLWPNIAVAGARMAKEIVEPMFAQMLPGPLASLRFVKLDLGTVPMRVSAVEVHKIDDRGIKLDLDIEWDGQCDIELDGKMIPKVGVEHVKLRGRMAVLLAPLTNIIPLIGAAQVAFINPPTLSLDFTDAANIADCALLSNAIRKVIISIISSMAVLPNRFLVRLDAATDFFKAYQPHIGVLRLTVDKATGVGGPKKSGVKRFFDKIAKDIPDCYCKVNIGAEDVWRTTTKNNTHEPAWNETHDFLVMDDDQAIAVDVQDDDLVGDDDIGIASTTVRDILLAGGSKELALTHNGEATPTKVTLHAKFYELVADPASLSPRDAPADGLLVGLATVLVAGAFNLTGQRDALNPSVRITWGDKVFQTPAKTYSPGVDIFTPARADVRE
jgi:Ca2+-dependent lipid-binding protein